MSDIVIKESDLPKFVEKTKRWKIAGDEDYIIWETEDGTVSFDSEDTAEDLKSFALACVAFAVRLGAEF